MRFQADVEASPEMLDCNCPICSRSGYLHLFVRHENFTLLEGEADLTSYKFGSGEADHLFCRHCGVKSFYQPRSHPESWSINYKCLDEGHELKPSIRKFDGQNWEASKRAL
ncbi:MAG: GFA family protein [Parasphingorhabdus sp.]|uniref:GFA family protein n=1 Tax=Parasphingorhabdus sp. TaxID=2709688 RepID=UPI00329A7F3B